MDIEGMGAKTVDRLFEAHIIHSIPDIYDMDFNKISKLEGFGQQSANNLRNAVEVSKRRPLSSLINALGIHYIGGRTAAILAGSVACLTDIICMKKEQLAVLPDIGDTVATCIYEFFHQKENVQMIRLLEKAGVNIYNSKRNNTRKGKLSGLTLGH